MTDLELFHRLNEGDQEALGLIYQRYRVALINKAVRNFSCSAHDAEDLYQEAIIALRKTVLENRAVEAPEGYLFQTMKFLHKDRQRKGKNTLFSDDLETLIHNLPPEILPYGGEADEYVRRVKMLIEKMEGVCNAILKLRLIFEWDYQKISENMNYSASEGAKNQFWRCLNKLKEAFFNRP